MKLKLMQRVDVQVSLLVAFVTLVTGLSIFAALYTITYREIIAMLENDVYSLMSYIETEVNFDAFAEIDDADDMNSAAYEEIHAFLNAARNISGTQYLYTAVRNEDGDLIYHVDGLDYDDEDFRNVGDLIEPEFQEDLTTALSGEVVMPQEILNTEWGDVFVAYHPLYNASGEVIAAVGIEFPASSQYQAFQEIRIIALLVIAFICAVTVLVVWHLFRYLSNPNFKNVYNTDFLTGLKNRTAFELDVQNNLHSNRLAGMTLMLSDLNCLKRVNDKAGHKVGDTYICGCANALAAAAQGDCVVYRIGGDEFATIIPAEGAAQIATYIERVKNEVAKIACEEIPDPSVSIGYAICKEATTADWARTQREADSAMYTDKKAFYDTHANADARH